MQCKRVLAKDVGPRRGALEHTRIGMDRVLLIAYLALAEEHVVAAHDNLTQLRAVIESMRNDGFDMSRTAHVVKTWESWLTVQIANRDRLRSELRRTADA